MTTDPFVILIDEHKMIIRVVEALKVFAENMEDGWEVEEDTLNDIIEFMRIFAQKWHHAKEEDVLFPALIKRGVPAAGCPLVHLKNEHKKYPDFSSSCIDCLIGFYRRGFCAERLG